MGGRDEPVSFGASLASLALRLVALRAGSATPPQCDHALAALAGAADFARLDVILDGLVLSAGASGRRRMASVPVEDGVVRAPVLDVAQAPIGLVLARPRERGNEGVGALVREIAETCARAWQLDLVARVAQRWADAIHDGPVQALSAAALHLGHAREQQEAGGDATATLATGLALVDRGLGELRLAIQEPYADEFAGASSGADDDLAAVAAAAASPWGLPVTFDASDAAVQRYRDADPRARDLLVRATREGVANAAKHAPAGGAEVVLRSPGRGTLEVAVRDFGATGAPTAAALASGHGLAALRRSAAQLGGAARLDRADGAGGLLVVRVPVSPA